MSAGAACHVLIVDDDRELRALVGKYLAEHGFRVTQAANGREMMKAIEVGRFDLVVLDLMMPGESGLVLCQKLREQNGPPVIMLTAMGSEVDRVIGLEIGADDPAGLERVAFQHQCDHRRRELPLLTQSAPA